MKSYLIALLLLVCLSPVVWAQTIPYSVGRIAVSSDGNDHDHDDWPATPMTLALLASRGLQDQTRLYTFSDHVWGSGHEHGDGAEQMRTSALGGQKWFGFEKTEFIEAVANPEAAYEAMKREINRSSAEDPLTIIAAGPMQVVGEAIARSDKRKLKHVRLISHSPWNNKHRHANTPSTTTRKANKSWTWDELEAEFAQHGLFFDYIANQNGRGNWDGLRAHRDKYDWVRDSDARSLSAYKERSWDWLYTRLESCIKANGTEFDPSDAGMVVYLLTGIDKTDPEDVRRLMENPIIDGRRLAPRE